MCGLLVTALLAFYRSRFACPAGAISAAGCPGCPALFASITVKFIGDNAFGLLCALLTLCSLSCGCPAGAKCSGESWVRRLLVTALLAFYRSRFACPAGAIVATGGTGCRA